MASIKLKDYLESLTSKGSISNNDLLPLLDSDSSNALKKITKGNLTNLESISGWTAFSSSVQSTSNTSLKDIVGLGNYTASLKGAIEVSGQNVNVLGMITAQQFNVTYVSSSVQFKSGSTEFGDSIDDTHTITGTIILNGSVLELSQLNNFSSSIRNEINGIEAYTSSLKSKLIVSSSTQIQNYDVFALNSNLYTATGSLIGITNGLMAWTASLDSTYATDVQLLPILQATRSLELLSGSMIGITNGLMAYTASNETWRNGIRAEINGIEAWTASIDSIYASDAQLLPILQATRSLEILSGSMIGITNGLMAYTASNETWRNGIRAEINGIEAWTASLDSIYASDSQLLQLYQATRSLEILSGSLIGITNGLMAFTAGLDSTYATDAQLLPILQATASINLTTGSLIGITNGLMAFTAALDSTYATDAQLLPILQATRSLELFSGSLLSEIAGIEAYTASLKGAAIVSSSQQIKNYIAFVSNDATSSMTASYATMAGLAMSVYTPSGTANQFLYQSAGGGSSTTTSTSNITYDAGNTSLNVANIGLASTGTIASALDRTNNISMHDGSFGLIKIRNGGTDRITLYRNTDTIQLSGSLLVNPNNPTTIHQITGSIKTTGSMDLVGKQTITGSLNVTGSITLASGSITMPNRPAFRLIGDGGQIIAPYTISGSRVVMDYNQGNHFNTTNGLFRAPIAGLYQVNLVVRTHSNTNSTINQAIVYKSGSNTGGDVTQIMVEYGINTSMNHSGGSTISYLDVGDTLKAVVAVGTCSFDSNDNFSVAYIG